MSNQIEPLTISLHDKSCIILLWPFHDDFIRQGRGLAESYGRLS